MAQTRRRENKQKKNKTHIKYCTPAWKKKTKELKQTIQSAPDAIPDYVDVDVDVDAEREYWIHE